MKMVTVTNEWREMVIAATHKGKGRTRKLKQVQVNAWVYGCWALHNVTNKKEGKDYWAVTHVPTGARLTKYPDAPTCVEYTPIVEALHKVHGNKWNIASLTKVGKAAIACKDIWQIKTPAEAS